MADHLTEEEQIEALKRWWGEYWKSVVIPIVLVAAGYYGWSVYQTQKEAKAGAGGLKYEQLVEVMNTSPGESLSTEKIDTAKAVAKDMVQEFKGTLYADHANLILARFAAQEGNLAQAAEQLQQVVDEGNNNAIKMLAKSRLARVKVSQGEFDAAIALSTGNTDSEFKSVFAEIRGDALASQGKSEAASTAFQEAIDSLPASQFSRRSILQMKIDGVDILAGAVPPAPVAEEPSAETPEKEMQDKSDMSTEQDADGGAGAENS